MPTRQQMGEIAEEWAGYAPGDGYVWPYGDEEPLDVLDKIIPYAHQNAVVALYDTCDYDTCIVIANACADELARQDMTRENEFEE